MLPTDTITAGSALKSVSESVKAARLTKNHSQREKTCHGWSVTQQITLIRTFPGSVGKLVGVFGSWSLRKPRKTACAVICPICLSGAGFRKRIKDVKGWDLTGVRGLPDQSLQDETALEMNWNLWTSHTRTTTEEKEISPPESRWCWAKEGNGREHVPPWH